MLDKSINTSQTETDGDNNFGSDNTQEVYGMQEVNNKKDQLVETSSLESMGSVGKRGNNLLILLLLIVASSVAYLLFGKSDVNFPWEKVNLPGKKNLQLEFEKFSSNSEFLTYLEESSKVAIYPSFTTGVDTMETRDLQTLSAPTIGGTTMEKTSERSSSTNVQVAGVDEADIVKNDGENIYTSSLMYSGRFLPAISDNFESIMPPDYQTPKTKIIKGFPVESMKKLSEVDMSGNLLLSKENLVILAYDKISAYDVSDAANPKSIWTLELENDQELLSSRLIDDQLYLVVRKYVSYSSPCPIPVFKGEGQFTIPCTDIYYPRSIKLPVDSVYSVMKIAVNDGKIQDEASFVGSVTNSQVYVSKDNLYISYFYNEDIFGFMSDFYEKSASDIIPSELIAKLKQVRDMDISDEAKMLELSVITQKLMSGMSADEQLKFNTELENRMTKYIKDNVKSLERTGLAKISTGDLELSASTSFPGSLLNQFSMDEYEGNLRIATTLGMNMLSPTETLNEVQVFDADLNIIGTVSDLGLSERIYSARFIGDRGYVVTFRQIDPFYVLDLSDPKNPKKTGELKIPGYSSYLHPINEDLILGVGMDGSKVKISMFDVSDPASPKEVDMYTLDEYWTEVSSNHHAFLLDDKHKVFFLPGSRGGYIFGYANNKFELKKAVSETNIQRAIYIDDYLYLISANSITVLNENTWETAKTFSDF